MLPDAKPIIELEGIAAHALPDDVLRSTQPLVLRGLVADWPLVQAGLKSPRDGIAYLRRFSRDATVAAIVGAHQHRGRLFYNEDMSTFNFDREAPKLDAMFDTMLRHLHDPEPPTLYLGSTTVDTFLPGLRGENDLNLGTRQALYSIWVGNRTRIAAHHDVPDNLACVAIGHRRFTLFPPEQVANLYIGPLDLTPAGQAISLVDFHAPDLERFPKFAEAMAYAQIAELGPGDALFIPSMWWHHIEALDSFNVLLNYWWRQSPAYMDTPMNALMLAIMCVRDLPEAQRTAWREMFRHYVFDADETTAAHIAEHARGALSPMTADASRALRAQLLKRLNR